MQLLYSGNFSSSLTHQADKKGWFAGGREKKKRVNVTSWGLSHEGLGIRSVAEFAVSYLCMKATERGRQRQRGRRRVGERRGVLGSPQSLGKGRQAALSSGEDSIINDASTRSHLGIRYSLGDLLHLILSRVRCGLPACL